MNAPSHHDHPSPSMDIATLTGDSNVVMGFNSAASFALLQRAAKMFAVSTMVPTAYQAVITKGYGEKITYEQNPAALGNCCIALDMATRMNSNPVMIMQNLHVIEGRPSWSSQFIIAAINNSGKFSPLRFEMKDLGEMEATYATFEWETSSSGKRTKVENRHNVKIHNKQCIAWAIELATGERLESAPVTIEMAVAEGWYGKNGSKWRSMADLMLRYRSGAFFGRIYAPELLMGLPSADEVRDIIDITPTADGSYEMEQSKPVSAEEKHGVRSKSASKATETETVAETVAETVPAETKQEQAETVSTAVKSDAATTTQKQPEQKPDDKPAQQQSQRSNELAAPGGTGDRPLSESEFDFLKSKMEESALGSADVLKRFGIKLDQLTTVNYRTVLNWVKNPI